MEDRLRERVDTPYIQLTRARQPLYWEVYHICRYKQYLSINQQPIQLKEPPICCPSAHRTSTSHEPPIFVWAHTFCQTLSLTQLNSIQSNSKQLGLRLDTVITANPHHHTTHLHHYHNHKLLKVLSTLKWFVPDLKTMGSYLWFFVLVKPLKTAIIPSKNQSANPISSGWQIPVLRFTIQRLQGFVKQSTGICWRSY